MPPDPAYTRLDINSQVIVFILEFGAGNETRTRDPNLGKVVLYQLSYSRLQIMSPLNADGYCNLGFTRVKRRIDGSA